MQLMRGLLISAMPFAAAALLSACTSASLGDAAPTPSAQAAGSPTATASPMATGAAPQTAATTKAGVRASHGTATRNAQFVEAGASHTNVYPKFVPPHPATTQMTDAEKKAFEAQMAARIKANEAPAESPAEYQERMKLMRALAAEHGSDTLREIEQ